MSDKSPKYEVGYKKPPKHTRFKRGVSGNPKGRPRKKPTIQDDIAAELLTRIELPVGDRIVRITKGRAIVRQQVHAAIRGDLGAAKFIVGQLDDVDREGASNLHDLIDEFERKNQILSTAEQLTTVRDDTDGEV